jgi:DNA polymerase-3 subunit epsilon
MMTASDFPPMVFLDLETTGATATRDRITEVGLVEVTGKEVLRHSQLVNPQARIPEFIQRLTGITDDMVCNAPTFAEIADDLFDRLQGKLMVAHNARFDHGFLKNEFKRVGLDFRVRVLCTVKLSRALYPQEARHSLDALIMRHGLLASGRHRALADADLIHQFWMHLQGVFPSEILLAEIGRLTARPSLPSMIDADLPDRLPQSSGVYVFYGENDFPLYVGKSNNLRQRVLSHFSGDHARGKEMSLSLQVRNIEWHETEGEVGALLREAALVKTLLPSHNTRLRRNKDLCAWRVPAEADGGPPQLVWARDLDLGTQPDLYGVFRSQRDALRMLTDLAQTERLCKAVLGLEKVRPDGPCFGVQIQRCDGACVGRESLARHRARLLLALARHRMPIWPYRGPVGLREGADIHVLDAWCHLGTARREEEVRELLEGGCPVFDLDVYRILRKAIRALPLVNLGTHVEVSDHAEDV